MKEGKKDVSWPVLVQSGEKRTAALMNRKAYRKSLEQGVPWIVHPLTGRVLPWPGEPRVQTLEEQSGCFALSLPEGSSMQPYGADVPAERNPDDRSFMVPESREGTEDGTESIIEKLVSVLAQRRQTMSKDSYTSHLFSQGEEKIRKKLGEEAIELLLTENEKDLIYESADFLYHLLVLFEASGARWQDVLLELKRRYESG